jgi:hypothetical protein
MVKHQNYEMTPTHSAKSIIHHQHNIPSATILCLVKLYYTLLEVCSAAMSGYHFHFAVELFQAVRNINTTAI